MYRVPLITEFPPGQRSHQASCSGPAPVPEPEVDPAIGEDAPLTPTLLLLLLLKNLNGFLNDPAAGVVDVLGCNRPEGSGVAGAACSTEEEESSLVVPIEGFDVALMCLNLLQALELGPLVLIE